MASPRFICLDTEFISFSHELLELAIYDVHSGGELLHQFYKPRHARRWSSAIHGITPERVAKCPYFDKRKRDVQRIFNAASHVVGFAVSNDISELRAAGLEHLDSKTHVDVRDFYWLCIGAEKGYTLFNTPGLAQCAADMGIELSADAEHTASGDAAVTMELFLALADKFRAAGGVDADAPLHELWDAASALIEAERQEHFRRCATGYATLYKQASIYTIKVSAAPPEPPAEDNADKPQPVATISVADRHRAEHELAERFKTRATVPGAHSYRLGPSHIAYFKRYSNTYDAERAAAYRALSRAKRGR